jgi:hypothetical protein
MHAMQTTIATTIGSSPGSLAFAWGMFLIVPLITDWQVIMHTFANIMSNENLHMPIGSNVRMTKLWDNKFWRSTHPTKLRVRMEGPSTIERVHVNGNLIILLGEGITERINIHRDLLYCWPFHIPLWRQLLAWVVLRFSLFTTDPFSPPHIRVSCRWSFSGSTFCLFIYGRASLAMERKSVVPMEITFMENGGNIFVLDEFIDQMNSYIWICTCEFISSWIHVESI